MHDPEPLKARHVAALQDDLEERIARLAEEESLDAMRPPLDGQEVMEHLGIEPGRSSAGRSSTSCSSVSIADRSRRTWPTGCWTTGRRAGPHAVGPTTTAGVLGRSPDRGGLRWSRRAERTEDAALSGLTEAEVAERVARGQVNDVRPFRAARSPDRRANVLTRFNALLGGMLIVILIVGRSRTPSSAAS